MTNKKRNMTVKETIADMNAFYSWLGTGPINDNIETATKDTAVDPTQSQYQYSTPYEYLDGILEGSLSRGHNPWKTK